MTAVRPAREGHTGVNGIRKPADISRKSFLHVVEENESCTEEAGAGLKVGEARCRAKEVAGLGRAAGWRAPSRYSRLRLGDTRGGEGEEGVD